ncbi:MAG: cation:proton antiporter subunit C [Pseudomonadota bacterium]
MFEFILARGSYLLIIALMMTGLYITFEAQNLIKRLVGLSVFQTSVFLFYITLSKVSGGTAPILLEEDTVKKGYDEAAAGSVSSADEALPAPAVNGLPETAAPPTDTVEGAEGPGADVLQGDDASLMESLPTEPLADVIDNAAGQSAPTAYESIEPVLNNVYSNPLPHVLILTAIVVGVATLAVGLAIIVRIREAYGTIEADEVRQIDSDVALAEEAGDVVPEGAA